MTGSPRTDLGILRDEILGFVTDNGGVEAARVVDDLIQNIAGMKYELLSELAASHSREYWRGHADGYAKAINEMDGEA